MTQEFIGTVKLFAGTFVPRNYLACSGQLLPISQYQALFSLLGTTYGGNGTTNFALPNLNGRVAVGTGQSSVGSNYTLGESIGQEGVTLSTNQLPPHTHTPVCYTSPGTTASPVGAVWAGAPATRASPGSDPTAFAPTSNGSMSGSALSVVGGGQPTSVLQPLLAMNYIICVAGVFPSRN